MFQRFLEKYKFILIINILILFCNSSFLTAQETIENIYKDISILSSDSMKGRLVGSEGEKLAADYIEKRFKEIKLSPLPNHSFQQEFSFNYSPRSHSGLVKSDTIKGINVIGFLDNKSKYTFIIGAHYDHLGRNEYGQSTDNNGNGKIHNGADDNASGVAAVLELANIYSTNKFVEPVNFIFACFSGEELGLIGSKEFAKTVVKDFENTTLMINFDMIGRMDSLNTLTISGTGTSTNFESILKDKAPNNFNIKLDSSGAGPSDHSSFYYQEIAVLFFFTGLHSDYHKPSDDSDKINFRKTGEIISYSASILDTLSLNPNLTFLTTKLKKEKETPAFKITLGIFPDYTDYGDGLHLTDVISGKTAEKYGLKKGDVITKIGKTEIIDIYTYMEALSKLEKNKTYKVVFKRNEVSQRIKIKF